MHQLRSDGSGHLAGTKAAGAGVNALGGTVDDRLHSLHIGFPGSVGTSVRMGNLDAECNIFAAVITLCHVSHLLV